MSQNWQVLQAQNQYKTKKSIFLHFLIFIEKDLAIFMDSNYETFLWIIQNQKKIHEEYIQRIS